MLKRAVLLLLLALILGALLLHAGSFLIVNQPEHADVIVVMGGGNNDLRYWTALRLLHEGWAPRVILDVFDKGITFGNRDIDLARAFVEQTAPGQATVCPIAQNSTYDEAEYLGRCLRDSGAKSLLVVTSAYHTRRTMEIFRKRLPQYKISLFAADDPYFFGAHWWKTREWAKTTVAEWQRYLWWTFVDRWRSGAVVQ